MKYVLTNLQMREADRHTIEEKGIPSSVLMGGAGNALAEEVKALTKGRVLCVCGGGNNGGDGLVCARVLSSAHYEADVVCFTGKRTAECDAQYRKWLALGGEIHTEFPDKAYDVVVDCLFGTGFHGEATGREKEAILAINALKERGAVVLSADIPSGVDGENGLARGAAVRADITLCIGELKAGVLLADGIDCAGEVKRADIGIILPEKNYATLLCSKQANALLPKRKKNSHKGSYGRAAIVAGSLAYTGAAYLSAAACLKSGAGYTSLFLPKELVPLFALKAPEILLRPICEGGMYAFNEEATTDLLAYESVAYGMGMGISEEVFKGLSFLLQNYEGKLLVDADGLNSLAKYGALDLLKDAKCAVVLTPHAKEFSRLTGLSLTEIFEGGLELPKRFAKEYACTLLVKGATSIVTDGEAIALVNAGNSGQAKGGSGDVLAGVIAALLAQGCTPFDGAALGAYLTGTAAEIAAKRSSEYSLTASDIVASLGLSFRVAENAHDDRADD